MTEASPSLSRSPTSRRPSIGTRTFWDSSWHITSRRWTPTFGVKDIEHARSQLEGNGVRFDGDTIEIPEMVKLATFFDPDGNSLMLYQTLCDQMP
jgi:predicted enzyme related to lactoylglutathione lyase